MAKTTAARNGPNSILYYVIQTKLVPGETASRERFVYIIIRSRI